ncbi:MAG: thiamine-phosphate kinase [Caldiserica bacterium]|nr:thiamine-phosphate kinase [Caldisericota bacterium]
MDEDTIISRIESILPDKKSPDVVLGIGDDTAVIKWKDDLLLFTCDTLVEGTHFRREYFPLYNLGWKSMAVSASDIYAMGGEPKFSLLSLGIPGGREEEIDEIYRGVRDFSSHFRVMVVGGNLTSSPFLWIESTIIGVVDEPITRQGAREGDLIVVTGYPGEARAGRELLEKGMEGYTDLKRRFLKPFPRREILKIIEKLSVNAMIDISDGVGRDLRRLLKESKKGAFLKKEKFPVSPALKDFGGEKAFHYFWGGGEDYEMLFTVPERVSLPSSIKGVSLTVIGKITGNEGEIATAEGELKVEGFDHFDSA